MPIEQLLLISLFAIGASFVQRVSGFGFGIFIMTLLPHVMPSYGEATTLSGLLASVTSLIIVVRMHKHIVWSKLWHILAAFLVFSFFAVSMVKMIDSAYLKKVLGVILIAVSLYFIFLKQHIKPRANTPAQLCLGSMSGLLGGFCGMQGPPAVLYFLAACPTKEQYIALTQTYFLLGNMAMTIFRGSNGMLTHDVGNAFCFGIVAVMLGTWLGGKVFNAISRQTLQRIVYVYIGVSGVVALLI
ncbi:MAG: sulfite exporter TauE/SafE family protein [Muribaculaceae bacterium]